MWGTGLFFVFDCSPPRRLTKVFGGEQEINKAYGKVINLFKTNLAKTHQETARPNNTAQSENANLTATAQDILILLLPYMSTADAQALFELCLTPEVLSGKDNGIQKRGYKILSRLLEGGKVTVKSDEVLKRLDELVDGLLPAAKKVTSLFQPFSVGADRMTDTVVEFVGSILASRAFGGQLGRGVPAYDPYAHTRGCFRNEGTL